MILLLIDFLHDDNHDLNATITPNDNNSTRDVPDAIINTIVNFRTGRGLSQSRAWAGPSLPARLRLWFWKAEAEKSQA